MWPKTQIGLSLHRQAVVLSPLALPGHVTFWRRVW